MPDTASIDHGACFETSSVTLEWQVNNVAELFNSTSGDSKSKAMKSPLFGNGAWQVLFYANAGNDHKDFSSIYLSAEPTTTERDPHGTGQLVHDWSREGLFKFVIEIKAPGKTHTVRTLEATDHQFTSKTANWGWTKYAQRVSIYPSNPMIKQSDTMLIVATVTHTSPVKIIPLPITEPRVFIPADLVKATGNLLNRPEISDVRFIIEALRKDPDRKVIYAQKTILQGRSDYFSTSTYRICRGSWLILVFLSSFSEGRTDSDMTDGTTMTTVTVTDTSYDTFHAMLYFLYTHRVKFTGKHRRGRRRSSMRNSHGSKTNDVEMEEDDDGTPREEDDREDVDISLEEEEDASHATDSAKFVNLIDGDGRPSNSHPPEPKYLGPHSPRRADAKSLYRLADRYGLTSLSKRCFIHLTQQCLTPRTAFMELVDSFAHDFPDYRSVVLEYVCKHWQEIIDCKMEFDEVMRGGQSRFVGFAEAWGELAPHLNFKSTDAQRHES